MSWNYNEVGVKYNEAGYQYNGFLATIKKYYTGFAHTTKAIFRRGIGF
jgi:hypothetical protein